MADRPKSAIALDRLMAVINERTTIEPRHRPAIRASLRAYRRAIEAEAASPAALDVDWLAEQLLLIDGNHDAFVARVHAERLLPRLHARLSPSEGSE